MGFILGMAGLGSISMLPGGIGGYGTEAIKWITQWAFMFAGLHKARYWVL